MSASYSYFIKNPTYQNFEPDSFKEALRRLFYQRGLCASCCFMMLLRFLDVTIGFIAAAQYAVLLIILPSVCGIFYARLIAIIAPPIVLTGNYAMRKVFPPIASIFPLVLGPAVHMAVFPIADLVFLLTMVGLTALRDKYALRTTGAAAFFGFTFPIIPTLLLRLPLPLPTLLAAVSASSLLIQSLTFRSYAAQIMTKSRRRRRSSQIKSQRSNAWPRPTPILTLVLFTITLVVVPPMTHLVAQGLRTIRPRALPPEYRILAQRRGPAGLVSVVEKSDAYRMLTADFSVLGGYHVKRGYAPDSIFSQFYVHEAVRLSRRTEDSMENIKDTTNAGGRNGRALCFGVGVGVVARALRTHGCEVDAVELDGGVAAFARDWFGFPGRIIVNDGRRFIEKLQDQTYDYIVHDVFSGGGISTNLVSRAEFKYLRRIIKKDGVFVINVVGATRGPAAAVGRIVAQRLQEVFGHVRLFSDGGQGRIDNIVIFASQTESAVHFRRPLLRDYLGSEMRQTVLNGFQQFEIHRNEFPQGLRASGVFARLVEQIELWIGMCTVAILHARVMNEVHPTDLWPALIGAEINS